MEQWSFGSCEWKHVGMVLSQGSLLVTEPGGWGFIVSHSTSVGYLRYLIKHAKNVWHSFGMHP